MPCKCYKNNRIKMRDKKYRSLLKAVSWRIFAVLITFSITLMITGNVLIATTIGILDSLIKIFVYYIHERTWEKINFGREIGR